MGPLCILSWPRSCLIYMDLQCIIWRLCFVSITEHGYAHLVDYHIWPILGCLQVLTSFLIGFSLCSILDIYCKVFRPSALLLTSHFRGHLLHLYFPPLGQVETSYEFYMLKHLIFLFSR